MSQARNRTSGSSYLNIMEIGPRIAERNHYTIAF